MLCEKSLFDINRSVIINLRRICGFYSWHVQAKIPATKRSSSFMSDSSPLSILENWPKKSNLYSFCFKILSMNKENFRLCSLYDEESRVIHFHNFTGRTVILSSKTKPELNSSKFLWSCGVVIPNGGLFVWKFLGKCINFTILIFNWICSICPKYSFPVFIFKIYSYFLVVKYTLINK